MSRGLMMNVYLICKLCVECYGVFYPDENNDLVSLNVCRVMMLCF